MSHLGYTRLCVTDGTDCGTAWAVRRAGWPRSSAHGDQHQHQQQQQQHNNSAYSTRQTAPSTIARKPPSADAEALYNAMKGFAYNRDMEEDIVQETSGHFKKMLVVLLQVCSPPPPPIILIRRDLSGTRDESGVADADLVEQDAQDLFAAGEEQWGTDEAKFIMILGNRSVTHLKMAYKKSLEGDIQSDTSGHFCRILVSLVQGAREEGQADIERANADAQELADACNADSDDMEMKFMSILCTRSFPHLRRVFQEFVRFSNKDIEQIIKKEMSGDVKNAFYAIVRSVKNQPSYFADRLYKAMKGLGTDDRALIRIMVSRCEVDLFNIRKEFKETHDESLHDFIQGDTSGDYRKTLHLLCGGED
ncbi:hypothetical protein CRUP_012156 [Coryphaenoides rupestris]|nr:hypothetical protein CRUP_012156 [Coryphaenoides rupestris]